MSNSPYVWRTFGAVMGVATAIPNWNNGWPPCYCSFWLVPSPLSRYLGLHVIDEPAIRAVPLEAAPTRQPMCRRK